MNKMLPLDGIRVLDLSRLLPGPYATMFLADMGAEVIKIETPRLGDYVRLAPDEFGGPGMFYMLNRDKKSLALNYRNQRGREIFHKLAATADLIIETFKPGAMARWGFDYESLRKNNPRIIVCSLSGYGQDGPFRDRAGHDINYTSVGGLVGLNGKLGGAPIANGVQIADMGGGMLAAMSILGALLSRERTGQGAYLDVAMLDLVVSWAMPIAGSWFFYKGTSPDPGQLPLSGGWPCFNVYQTADGKHMSLGALEDPFWSAFCKTVGRNDLLESRFDSAIIPQVAAIFIEKTQSEWIHLFEGIEVCLEPVNGIEEMLQHPQVKELI